MTALQLLADSCNERDALPVLISAPLRPGVDRAHISRYGDPVWDLAPGVFRENARRCHVTVHFAVIQDLPSPMPCARFFMRVSMSIYPATVHGLSRRGCAARPTGSCVFSTS